MVPPAKPGKTSTLPKKIIVGGVALGVLGLVAIIAIVTVIILNGKNRWRSTPAEW
jgi:hypothetical protein